MSTLSIDFETRATVDLRKTGVYPYAQHKDTDIWCMAWAFDDEEPEIWTPPREGELRLFPAGLPQCILNHIVACGEIRAWNAQFERVIWNEIMVKRYHAPAVTMNQWVCSAAEAAAMALPRSLDQAAKVLGVSAQKDTEGYALMMRMTRPRSVKEDGTPVWWEVEDRKQRLYAYCKQDVRTERAIVPCLRRLGALEREVYLFNQRLNDRGVPVDLDLARAAQEIADEGVERANAVLFQLTDGEVSEVTNHKRLTTWVREQGVVTEGVSKKAVREMLESDLDPVVREVLETRADAGRSSIAKLRSMFEATCDDGRARGLVLYHAATTGREGGRLIQPHNFPRGEVPDVENYIDAVMRRQYEYLDLFYHPIIIVSSMLRSMLTAGPGNELIAGDYSAIEARVLNWIADEAAVLESFRAYDRGDKSQDPYKRMAVAMGRGATVHDVTKDDRQAGKAAELGCGFQMGAETFVRSAWDVYGVRVSPKEAKTAVDAYRGTHPMVKALWYDAEGACKRAVSTPGQVQMFGGLRNLKAIKAGAYLYVVLPSGRPLCYAAPSIEDALTSWGEMKPTLHYWGLHPKTNQWVKLKTYGGHLVENIVQAIARDLMVEAQLRLEANNYPPILAVHDEIIAEVPEGFGDVKEYERLLAELPAWAEGCPVAAEGWRGFRYRK